MADPFTQCHSVNKAGFRCWLCLGHRVGIHETHPPPSPPRLGIGRGKRVSQFPP